MWELLWLVLMWELGLELVWELLLGLVWERGLEPACLWEMG